MSRSLTGWDSGRVDTFADDFLARARSAAGRGICPAGLDRFVQVVNLDGVWIKGDGPHVVATGRAELDCLRAFRRRGIVGDIDARNVDIFHGRAVVKLDSHLTGNLAELQ